MSKVQTDNSKLIEKVRLRLDSIKEISKQHITVLECFSGNGVIWNEVRMFSNADIRILKMDVKNDRKGVYLKGNNLKFLPNMDLSEYDIIDLDAYGSPFKQLEYVFKSNFNGIVHCTYIQTFMGKLDYKMLNSIGYSNKMIKKIPTLFSTNALEKMVDYLGTKGAVEQITGYFLGNKNYFYFKINH
ncbi:MAG: hypothetical protein LBQ73_07550 [Tannerellaceae bacterium]|jgi:hypothetical protein|nr:hypothetical protein [Tannerellaceae bacterium]